MLTAVTNTVYYKSRSSVEALIAIRTDNKDRTAGYGQNPAWVTTSTHFESLSSILTSCHQFL